MCRLIRILLSAFLLGSPWAYSQVLYGPVVASSIVGGVIAGPSSYPAQADTLIMTATVANSGNVWTPVLQTAPTQTGPWTACITSTVTGNSGTATVTASCKPQGGLYYRVLVTGGAPLVLVLVDSSGVPFTLSAPRGVIYDSSHHITYISDSGNNRILAYNQSTGVTAAVTLTGVGALNNPGQLSQNNNADIYIADTGNSRILDYNISAGTTSVLAVGSPGGVALLNPDGLSGTPSLQLYIADTGHNRLLLWNGTSATVVSDVGFTLSSPHGIGLDASTPSYYLTDTANNRILKYVPGTGSTVLDTTPYSPLLGPLGSAFYGTGTHEILFTDSGHNRALQKPDTGSNNTTPVAGLNVPGGFTLSNPNEISVVTTVGFSSLFIADTGNNRIIGTQFPATGGSIAVGILGVNSLVSQGGGGSTFVCNEVNNCAELNAANSFTQLNTFPGVHTNVLEDSASANGTTGQFLVNNAGDIVWVGSQADTQGEVLTSGSTPPSVGWQQPSLQLPRFQVAPNLAYSFISPGDQACSGSIHDVTGNGNNATILTAPTCNGNGLTFPSNTLGSIRLPAAANNDETFCTQVNLPTPQVGATNNDNKFGFIIGKQNFNFDGFVWMDSSSNGSFLWNPMTLITTNFQSEAGEYFQGQHVLCLVVGLTSNSTNDRLFLDGYEDTYRQQGRAGGIPLSSTFLTIGAGGGANPGTFTGDMNYFVGWSTQLTAAQVMTASTAIKQTVAQRGVNLDPPTVLLAGNYIVAIGDSITYGFQNTPPGPTPYSWLNHMSLTSATTYTLDNNATYGLQANSEAAAARWRDQQYCYNSSGKNIAIIFDGTNDVAAGISPVTAANSVLYNAYLMQQAGCTVFVGTMVSRVTSDTNKNTFNPYLRARAKAQGIYLIDFAAHPDLGANGAYTNTTYFNVDQIHPLNPTGQNTLGIEAANAINYVTGSNRSSPHSVATTTYAMLSSDGFVLAPVTTAASWTLPDCFGVAGYEYTIYNQSSGANTITFAAGTFETIAQTLQGSATLAQSLTATFTAESLGDVTAGCFWLRTH